MLRINADDYGKSEAATNNTLCCFEKGLISSGSLMVFMQDSRRASELSISAGMDSGLHLNFSLPFNGPHLSRRLEEYQNSLANYFRQGPWTDVVYNPLLSNKFEYVYQSQYDEYRRLSAKEPAHFDGHHHHHLCMNMILNRMIPPNAVVRRNFSFGPGEKSLANRAYRRMIDAWLARHYHCVDYYFAIEPDYQIQRLQKIIRLSYSFQIEIGVHPEKEETNDFLRSAPYRELISAVPNGLGGIRYMS
jgi:predicted glycoside hydrolase/deacetylase ChbG (UPF0249 family)